MQEELNEESFQVDEDFPYQYLYKINYLCKDIFGDDFGYTVLPYSEEDEKAIVMVAGSLKYEEVSLKAVFPTTDDAMGEARKAIISFAYRMYTLEQEKEESEQKLYVPEKKLIVPGK